MASFNKVILVGNLTRDPELRYTPSGTAIAKIGIAVNRTWKSNDTGESREEVLRLIREAIEMHFEGMQESGEAIPAPVSSVEIVEVPARA